MNTIKISFRNAIRQKKRSIMLGGAIAFGIMVITLLDGFTSGVEANVKANLAQQTGGHVFVSASEPSASGRSLSVIRDDAAIRAAVAAAAAKQRGQPAYLTKRSSVRASLIFGSKEVSLRVDGVDWSGDSFFKNRMVLAEGGLDGLAERRALILPAQTAAKLGVRVGENLLVRLATVSGQQNVDEFRLIGLLADAGGLGQGSGYARLDYVNSLINLKPSEYQTLNVYLGDMADTDRFSDALYAELAARARIAPRKAPAFPGMGGTAPDGPVGHGGMGGPLAGLSGAAAPAEASLNLTSLNELLGPFSSIISVLNQIGLGIFLVLAAITMVGITNTFRMIMLERTREIGTMRAVGMQRGGVRRLFLLEAFFIAAGGILAGLAAALLAMQVLSLVDFYPNPHTALFLDKGRLLFALKPIQLAANTAVIATLSLAAAWLPARRASRIDPAQALRTQY